MTNSILQFDSITKRFPGVLALDQVSFAIESGEVHALVGENGAGKSTLGKIIAGIYASDGGSMLLAPSQPYRARPEAKMSRTLRCTLAEGRAKP